MPEGRKRHDFQGIHWLRKICQTQLEIAGLKNVNIQTLMGRSLGVNDSYYRVTVTDLLFDYEKAIPLLSIDDTTRLQHRVISLEGKQDDIALMKLQHDQEMKAMREEVSGEIKLQLAHLLAKLKPEIIKKGISP